MKALVVQSPGEIRWQTVPEPSLEPGWARVEIRAVGICSSDVPRALDGAAYHYPIILGHEIAGVAAELGPGADPGLLGARVAVAPLIACHRCAWCQRGRYSLCDDYDYLGSRRDGGCAESVLAPVSNLIALPEEIPDESAALLEPAAVVLHGMNGRVEVGDQVAVLGCGTLGLFAVQWAWILGASKVLASDPLDQRLDLACRMGAEPMPGAPAEGLPGLKAGVVVVASGSPAAQVEALGCVEKGGRVLLLGLPHEPVNLPADQFGRIVREEIEVRGSWNSYSAPFPGDEWRASVASMASGRLQAGPLISRRVPLESAAGVYDLVRREEGRIVKVVLTRSDSASR